MFSLKEALNWLYRLSILILWLLFSQIEKNVHGWLKILLNVLAIALWSWFYILSYNYLERKFKEEKDKISHFFTTDILTIYLMCLFVLFLKHINSIETLKSWIYFFYFYAFSAAFQNINYIVKSIKKSYFNKFQIISAGFLLYSCIGLIFSCLYSKNDAFDSVLFSFSNLTSFGNFDFLKTDTDKILAVIEHIIGLFLILGVLSSAITLENNKEKKFFSKKKKYYRESIYLIIYFKKLKKYLKNIKKINHY